MAAILANPRYTRRQTWNRQRTDTGSLDATDDVLGRAEARRWNTLQDRVASEQATHPPLVSEKDFVTVQAIYATPKPADGSTRRFALTGLLFCQLCGRRLCGHWVHGRAGYRCRHGHTSAQVANITDTIGGQLLCPTHTSSSLTSTSSSGRPTADRRTATPPHPTAKQPTPEAQPTLSRLTRSRP